MVSAVHRSELERPPRLAVPLAPLLRSKGADRSRRALCYFVGAEVLKGRWASALQGSLPVGQKTGDNFMLV